jgi:hypothetical protein
MKEEVKHSKNRSTESGFLMTPQQEIISLSQNGETTNISRRPSFQTEQNIVLENKHDPTWETCCSNSERSFIKFVVQVAMGFLVIAFCMGLIALGDGEHDMIAFSLISGTMGLFFPHPSMAVPNPSE